MCRMETLNDRLPVQVLQDLDTHTCMLILEWGGGVLVPSRWTIIEKGIY